MKGFAKQRLCVGMEICKNVNKCIVLNYNIGTMTTHKLVQHLKPKCALAELARNLVGDFDLDVFAFLGYVDCITVLGIIQEIEATTKANRANMGIASAVKNIRNRRHNRTCYICLISESVKILLLVCVVHDLNLIFIVFILIEQSLSTNLS